MHDEVRENRRAKDGEREGGREKERVKWSEKSEARERRILSPLCQWNTNYEVVGLHSYIYTLRHTKWAKVRREKRKKARTRGEIERKGERAYVYVRKIK